MGLGKSGEIIDIASNALAQITNRKPNPRNAKKAHRDWGVRKGEPIGVIVTIYVIVATGTIESPKKTESKWLKKLAGPASQ